MKRLENKVALFTKMAPKGGSKATLKEKTLKFLTGRTLAYLRLSLQ